MADWKLVWLLALVALLLAAYGPAVTEGPYGVNDDYQYLYRVAHGTFDPAHNEQVGMGRPAASWGLNAAFGFCEGSMERLVALRWAALAGVVLLAWTILDTLAALRFPKETAATVSLLVALSPACGVYAAWASALFSPFALAGALFAGRLLMGRANWWRCLVAMLLLVGVCCTWQAAAPLALFPVLARAWRRGKTRWWWQVVGVCAGAILIYAGLSRWLAAGAAIGGERLALTTDVTAKGLLLGELLRSGVTSWARFQPGIWEWAVAVATAGACLLAVFDVEAATFKKVVRQIALAGLMILLSVSPLLVARENNAAFRSLPILYLTISFFAVQGLQRLLEGWLRVAMMLTLLALSTGAARYHVWHGLVSPNLREYTGLLAQVQRQFPDGAPLRLVYLVPPPTLLAKGHLTPSWEYGLVSSPFSWVTRPFLLLLFEQTAAGAGKEPDLVISWREAKNPGVPVLDTLPVLLGQRGFWQKDLRWGKVRVFRDGWRYSRWFGYFNVSEFPIIQHQLLGSLIYTSRAKDGDALWFHHRELGQIHTSEEAFPHLFLGRLNRWVFLSDDDRAHTYLDDYTTGKHLPLPP